MIKYRIATIEDLETIWDKDISNNNGEAQWIRWKRQYLEYNQSGKATTFVVLDNNQLDN